jgi:putative component of toxin-antitoxin plasmid stabilization module
MGDELEVVPTPWYEAELLLLPDLDQERIERQVDHLRQSGWRSSVSSRRIRPLRDGIWELRVLGHGPAYRVLFFVVPGRVPRAVVLTTCAAKSALKKRQRMDSEIARAGARRTWWLAQQSQEDRDGRR